MQSQYQDALKIAKQKVDAQERAETERLQRIRQATIEQNVGIEKYKKQNDAWKKKVDESFALARQGKLKEADEAYADGQKIYNSIPERFRRK